MNQQLIQTKFNLKLGLFARGPLNYLGKFEKQKISTHHSMEQDVFIFKIDSNVAESSSVKVVIKS